MKKVFISGFGTINPLGLNSKTTWENICNGKSGIDFIESFETKEFVTKIAGEVKNFNPADHMDKKSAQRMDRFAQFGAAAALQALKQSKIDLKQFDPYRIATIVGSGIDGLSTLSPCFFKALTVPSHPSGDFSIIESNSSLTISPSFLINNFVLTFNFILH